jgi:TrmH family RNA methyltransferase
MNSQTIASRQNVLFKRVRNALREHDREIVLEGRKQVADALASGWKPIAVITRGNSTLTAHPSQVAFAPTLFDQLSDTRSPQDVIALFERPTSSFADLLKRRDSLVVALDGVQDPGNVGMIVRLAAAFECAGLALLPGCADPFSPKAIRASVGSILSVPVANVTARELLDSKLPIYAADASGKTTAPPAAKAILVFGSEGSGVSDEIRRAATPIRVAMSARVESLNVAAAAAILLSKSYEARRGR